jgi:hypothetical protein
VRVDPASLDAAATAAKGVAPGTSYSRARAVNGWSPAWYDEAPRDPLGTFGAWMDALPENTWTTFPMNDHPNTARSWGRTIFDKTNQQLLHWTGGHQSDPTNTVQHFHIETGRWSIGHVAESLTVGNFFSGRPDCENHTYINIALDPVSNLLVAPQHAGTHLYDPALGDWVDFVPDQPFDYDLYSVKLVPTPIGAVAWTGGDAGPFFGRFVVANRQWEALPVTGTLPAIGGGDEDGIVYDSKRNRLILFATMAYTVPNGQAWSYDFAAKTVVTLDPTNRAAIDSMPTSSGLSRLRETVYIEDLDLVLFGQMYYDNMEVGYDVANNRWVKTNIARNPDPNFASVDCGLAFDADHKRLFSLCNYGQNYGVRVNLSTLTLTPL